MSEVGRKPTPLERKILVWTGKYASESQIPEIVPFRTFVKAKDMGRVYLAGAMGVVVAGFFLYTAIKGKRLMEQGHSVADMNQNWHDEYNKTGKYGGIHEVPNEFQQRMQQFSKK